MKISGPIYTSMLVLSNCYDWLIKNFQATRVLQSRMAKIYAGHFLGSFGPRCMVIGAKGARPVACFSTKAVSAFDNLY